MRRIQSGFERLQKVTKEHDRGKLQSCRVRSEQLITHIWDGQIVISLVKRDAEVKVNHKVTLHILMLKK